MTRLLITTCTCPLQSYMCLPKLPCHATPAFSYSFLLLSRLQSNMAAHKEDRPLDAKQQGQPDIAGEERRKAQEQQQHQEQQQKQKEEQSRKQEEKDKQEQERQQKEEKQQITSAEAAAAAAVVARSKGDVGEGKAAGGRQSGSKASGGGGGGSRMDANWDATWGAAEPYNIKVRQL